MVVVYSVGVKLQLYKVSFRDLPYNTVPRVNNTVVCCCLVTALCLTLFDPMGFSRQEYWSGLSFPSPVDVPDPGIELESAALKADSLPFSHLGSPNNVVVVVQSLSHAQLFATPWTGAY